MSVQDLVKDLVSQHNLAYRRFGKPGFLVYGTINPKVRKLVTMIYVKKVFRDRSNLLLKVKRTKNYKVNVTTIDILNIIFNIFLLFTKNQSRSTFESNWMCCWKKLSMGTIPHQIYTSRLTLPIHIVQREDSCSTPHL